MTEFEQQSLSIENNGILDEFGGKAFTRTFNVLPTMVIDGIIMGTSGYDIRSESCTIYYSDNGSSKTKTINGFTRYGSSHYSSSYETQPIKPSDYLTGEEIASISKLVFSSSTDTDFGAFNGSIYYKVLGYNWINE